MMKMHDIDLEQRLYPRSKRIYAGDFSRDKCRQERYQPFTFWTNGSLSDCTYVKSICSENGQIVYRDSSTMIDRSCRCNHKKNYSFIKTPKNVCFCIPTEEDCSCYVKSCPENLTLSADSSRLKTRQPQLNREVQHTLNIGKTVTSADFDIELMLHLLHLLANIEVCNLYPSPADTSFSAMLSRIKFINNEIAQIFNGKLSEDNFNKYWDDIGQKKTDLVFSAF
ncbi:unnamed protein product [Mytilus edulis]|uniref:DZIP3-like HEPN domain-containing protein n=1 Tax=Mytilus edulis TaxID=6550 RepID=A0A8S3RNY2_MYTED|nr:unnamed protein product [Mytilus edulis]